jgi:site-specific DNA-methyltransferase (adenine-specific)
MGKKWDNSGIAYDVTLWAECLRVLKPGGHLLSFGGTRTYHRMVCAIEDAGFEIRDCIVWLYSSGFPKSHNVGKAIDKAAGAKRQVTGPMKRGAQQSKTNAYGSWGEGIVPTAAATDDAKKWDGWGTALKPANEPIVVARKSLTGTIASNVIEHGTGAMNIDGARVKTDDGYEKQWDRPVSTNIGVGSFISDGRQHTIDISANKPTGGRWPANLIIDEQINEEWTRYFYTPKASKAERNAGLENSNTHPTVKPIALMRYLVRLVTPPGGTVLEPFAGSGTTLAAAILEGFNAIGCELTADYLPIIEGRVQWAKQQAQQENGTT